MEPVIQTSPVATSYLPGHCIPTINNRKAPNSQNKEELENYLPPEYMDVYVDKEMAKIMADYAVEEESYVVQQLAENPVICPKRSPARSSTDSSASQLDQVRQQRAESCRKSRINNKIKKAKSKFRHKFIALKLEQNRAALKGLLELINFTEAKLRSNGYSDSALRKLRNAMGVDRMEAYNLEEVARKLANATN